MSTGGRYLVQFDPYTKNHFIKSITRRYSSRQWQATRKSLEFVLEHIDQHISPTRRGRSTYRMPVESSSCISRLPGLRTRQEGQAIEL